MKKTVLITGASGGIGKAAVKAFVNAGYSVAMHYNKSRNETEERCRKLKGLGINAFAVQADISDRASVEKMFKEVRAVLGPVGVLVNNAGIAEQALFSDITGEMWDRMFDVNVKGAYLCTQSALPDMIHEKWGRIINISSMWGISGASCEVHYSASKAAIIGFTKALAKEVGPSGITVNCIAPGVIDTPMNGHLSPDVTEDLKNETPLNRIGNPDDVAEAMVFLAGASFITGQVLSVDGGFIL
ncbi:MAG: 3-oxoacyl-ACP reductase FabG [Oscillospiraceae bacterium]|nr:3-oxoacyl-ACP reductase FabG [Oscillospiraceae bacterium]